MTEVGILIGVAIMLSVFALVILVSDRKPKPAPKPVNIMSYDESLKILHEIILFHLNERAFTFMVNKFLTSPPVDEEIIRVTESVLNSMSNGLKASVLHYVNKDYLIRYIGSFSREMVIEYIEKKSQE